MDLYLYFLSKFNHSKYGRKTLIHFKLTNLFTILPHVSYLYFPSFLPIKKKEKWIFFISFIFPFSFLKLSFLLKVKEWSTVGGEEKTKGKIIWQIVSLIIFVVVVFLNHINKFLGINKRSIFFWEFKTFWLSFTYKQVLNSTLYSVLPTNYLLSSSFV